MCFYEIETNSFLFTEIKSNQISLKFSLQNMNESIKKALKIISVIYAIYCCDLSMHQSTAP